MGFKAFLEEDSSAVITQMRKVRDQMRVVRLRRQLAKEKEPLETRPLDNRRCKPKFRSAF